jgi:hypothetical protein
MLDETLNLDLGGDLQIVPNNQDFKILIALRRQAEQTLAKRADPGTRRADYDTEKGVRYILNHAIYIRACHTRRPRQVCTDELIHIGVLINALPQESKKLAQGCVSRQARQRAGKVLITFPETEIMLIGLVPSMIARQP